MEGTHKDHLYLEPGLPHPRHNIQHLLSFMQLVIAQDLSARPLCPQGSQELLLIYYHQQTDLYAFEFYLWIIWKNWRELALK